jgi:hypothetical protein
MRPIIRGLDTVGRPGRFRRRSVDVGRALVTESCELLRDLHRHRLGALDPERSLGQRCEAGVDGRATAHE